MLIFFRECLFVFQYILIFFTIGRMESRKLFVNIYGEISVMKSSKQTVELANNVAHDEVVSIDIFKTKNSRE